MKLETIGPLRREEVATILEVHGKRVNRLAVKSLKESWTRLSN